jgi:uncharacterized protein (DUF1499 family)
MTSTTAPTEPARTGYQLLRRLPHLALILAIVAVVLLALGPLGWRAGWWHFRVGFYDLMPWAAYCGLAAAVLAAIALVLGRRVNAARHIAIGVIAFIIGAAIAYVPWHWSSLRGAYPRVNDVTTDFDNPPSLAFAEAMRKAEHGHPVAYDGAKAAPQKKSYPDIAPAMLSLPPNQAFDRALAAAKAMGWTIIRSDPETGTIDADDRSRWFGFTDDIAIRVSPAGGGSRVDIRSGARLGGGDYGVNAARVRAYLAALRGS